MEDQQYILYFKYWGEIGKIYLNNIPHKRLNRWILKINSLDENIPMQYNNDRYIWSIFIVKYNISHLQCKLFNDLLFKYQLI